MRNYGKLFYGLRALIAESNILSTFQLGMGQIMSDIIEKYYIKPLRKEYKKTGDEEYAVKASEYVKYVDKGTREFQVWDKFAAKIVWSKIKKYHKDGGFQDVIQHAAIRLIRDLEQDGSLFVKQVDPLDLDKGPEDVRKFYSTYISRKVQDLMRSEFYRTHINPDDSTEGDEEGRDKWIERIPDERGSESIDRTVLKETYTDMLKYLSRKLHGDDIDMGIFKSWMDAVEKYGIGKVEFKNDVYKKLDKWGYVDEDIPYATAAWKWKRIRKLVAEFFEKELGMRLTDRQKKKLKLATADVVGIEYMRRAVARWTLDIR